MPNQNTEMETVPVVKINDQILMESQTARTSLLNQTDVLNRVKTLSTLPDDLHVSTDMVASYYEVSRQTITSIIHDHKDELMLNGLKVLRGAELISLKEIGCVAKRAASFTILSRRAVLLIGMLLRDSEVAKQVRAYLLDMESADAESNSKAMVLRWVAANIKILTESIASPRERMPLIERIYQFAGIGNVHVPETNQPVQAPTRAHVSVGPRERVNERWFACHEIAERYGLYSINNNLHIQLVGALVQTFGALIPEVDFKPFLVPTRTSAPVDVLSFAYSDRIAKRVGSVLEEAGWPDLIEIRGKRYKVMYRNRMERGLVRTLA